MKVLKIGATWYSGCLTMKSRWAHIERECPWLETTHYDFDADKSIVAQYHVDKKLPVFIFLSKDGKEFLRLSGEIEIERLKTLILENRHR